ncbi:MAG TPA: hypothetical protein VLM75_11020 [Spirochaetota bacterium]|nr:hypothetical protein [Spirochaetota bacterium]
MKRNKSVLCAAMLAVLFAFSAVAHAADLSVGASTWYSWWRLEDRDGTQTFDPALLYGPVLALGFGGPWSLSSIFLYGRFDMDNEGDKSEKIDRYDSDTALNYSINRYIKFFGGAKFMGYAMQGSSFSHMALGPALGIGVTLPVSDSLFILWNASGAFLFGKHQEEDSGVKMKSDYTEPGVNTNLSLAWYIESMSTTITLGFRYQLFGTFYNKEENFTDMTHQFYGITLSAVYAFAL